MSVTINSRREKIDELLKKINFFNENVHRMRTEYTYNQQCKLKVLTSLALCETENLGDPTILLITKITGLPTPRVSGVLREFHFSGICTRVTGGPRLVYRLEDEYLRDV